MAYGVVSAVSNAETAVVVHKLPVCGVVVTRTATVADAHDAVSE